MVDEIGGSQVAAPIQMRQKKKSGVGSAIVGTLASTTLGAGVGYFASNAMFDGYIREAKANIAHPGVVKKEFIEKMGEYAEFMEPAEIDSKVSVIIKSYEENIRKLQSSKNKWIAGAAIVGGASYLGCKALFGKKDKPEGQA